MNNINPIFKALGDVDDRHIPVNEKKIPGKKMKIALIATAFAAALSLIVGFSMPRTKSYGKSFIYYGPGKNDFVELYPTPQKFTYPDSFVFEEWDSVCSGELETLDEVREMFGITPIVNDNFTVGDGYGRHIIYNAFNTGLEKLLHIDYYLYDKNLGCLIQLISTHYTDVNFFETGNGGNSYNNVEIFTLKDGSQCVIIESSAYFVSDGVEYSVRLMSSEEPEDYDKINNDIKQVLVDLEML